MHVYIDKQKISLRPEQIIGSGGEAEIYDIGSGKVAKIFKAPNHGDFSGNTAAQKSAIFRIKEHQKKLRSWPSGLPKNVITPTGLVTTSGGKIVGYTMKHLKNTEVLLKFGEKKYRETHAIGHESILRIYKNLHKTLREIHKAGAVIGDFNDLNVMVSSSCDTYLIDADSMQFGPYTSRVFTARFVDPLLCKTGESSANLVKAHNPSSDWYGFYTMLFGALLFVSPYGGVHIPLPGQSKLKEWERVQKRITVMQESIRYPRPALHYSILPDELLDEFDKVFHKDIRREFPLCLLENMSFTSCKTCGKTHARHACPDCQPTATLLKREVISRNIIASKLLDISGRILYAVVQKGILRYIYHENETYYRENKKSLLSGEANPYMRIRIYGDNTVFSQKDTSVIMTPEKKTLKLSNGLFQGRIPTVDANSHGVFVLQGNSLSRIEKNSLDYPKNLGDILPAQTLVWVGEKLGFRFSRAGGINRCNVFFTSGNTLGSEADIGKISGQVLDATCVFSESHVWFMMNISENSKRMNDIYMFDAYGKLCGQYKTEENDGSWLGTIRGKCASGSFLFSPTDDGVMRVECVNNTLQESKVFSQTAQFVDQDSKLLMGKGEIYSLSKNTIWSLKLK